MPKLTPILLLLLSGCSGSAPPDPPAVTLDHAQLLLEHEGWKIMELPPGESPSFGCLEAEKSGTHGQVCFLDCAGRSVIEIASAMGSTYGYEVGPTEACTSYTTFNGSPGLRRAVAGEKYMSPHVPIPN